MIKLLAVRPYEDRIKQRIYRLLEQAGLTLETDPIPSGTSDDEVLKLLAGRYPQGLLIPYHSQSDAQGNATNGLELCQRIEAQLPEHSRIPILMPVSKLAAAGVRAMLGYRTRHGPVSDLLRARILLIDEAELNSGGLSRKVFEHVTLQSWTGQ